MAQIDAPQQTKKRNANVAILLDFFLYHSRVNSGIFASGSIYQVFATSQTISLGVGVEKLIAHPATMTHAAMDPDARRKAGIGDTLIRISVGIEAIEDLVSDLEAGLDQVALSLEQVELVGA